MGPGHVHLGAPDTYANLDSWLHRWEPRLKLAAGLGFVIGVTLLQTLPVVLGALGIALIAALSSAIPLRFFMERLLWVAPFLVLMTVTLALGGGRAPSDAGLALAGLVSAKALTALIVMIILLGTQSIQASLDALAWLRCPPLPVLALFLAYRYVFLFGEELRATLRSLSARGFRPGLNRHSLRVFGELTGTLLLNVLDRSERVYRAMTARGFDGRLHVGAPAPFAAPDIAKSLAALGAAAVLILIDRGMLF